MKEIIFCEACGCILDKFGNKEHKLCSKHYQQLRRYGEIKDHNSRTVYDPNEIRIYDDYAEIDTYDQFGNVTYTFTIDLEDVKYLNNHKWRATLKGKNIKRPYLVTGHNIYFHRLILGEPNSEIDHIDRNTLNNRKSNLRLANRTEQLYNTLKNSKSGIKGVYYKENRKNLPWHAEFSFNNKRYFSPQYETKEEAVYYRYLLENLFTKDFLICNSTEFEECLNNLSEDKKLNIQKCFANRMKVQVQSDLTKVANWSDGRQIERKTRVYLAKETI